MRGHFEAARDRLQQAFDTIEAHDRPLRRRRHQPEITAAKTTIRDLPEAVARYAADLEKLQAGITATEGRLADVRQHDQRRPALQDRLDDITSRLDDDRHIRTRQIRHNTPDRITDTLGARPTRAQNAQAWDKAAGQVDQHQTAYGLSSGLGPARRTGLPAGYLHSRTQTENAERNYIQAITLQQRRSIERDGPSMGISR
jgi:chromosome segregation ATPase